jgi:hypothetical protein
VRRVLARLRRVLVGRLGVLVDPGALGLGLGDADVLGVAARESQAFLSVS